MKKFYILFFLLPAVLNARCPGSCFKRCYPKIIDEVCCPVNIQAATKVTQSPPSLSFATPQEAARLLYKEQSNPDVSQFAAVLDQAMHRFNKEQFTQFLMTRSQIGWTALMQAAAIGDILQIAYIFQALHKKYGNDQQAIFNYINAQDDKVGYTALLLASDSGRIADVKAIVNPTAALLQGNNRLFAKFLNTSDYENENNPLILLTFDSSDDAMEFLVKKAAEVLGRKSDEYWEFINYKDNDGATPLLYALNADEREFLNRNGAIITKTQPKKLIEAQQLGKKFLNNMWGGNLPAMKKIMAEAFQRYSGHENDEVFYTFINTVDGSGSNPLIRAAAQGRMEYVVFILDAVEKRFKDHPYSIYNFLRNSTNNGKTALYLAIQQRHFDIAKLLIKTLEKYVPNKYFFYMYMTRKDQINHFPALLISAYNSTGDHIFIVMTKLILSSVAKYFPRGTREMDVFVNEWDQNGFTALDYVNAAEVRKVLITYGAQEGSELEKEAKLTQAIMCEIDGSCITKHHEKSKAHKLIKPVQGPIITNNPEKTAAQLYQAQKHIDLEQFNKILETAARSYNPEQFWKFLTTRNEIGMTALMVAIAYSDGEQLETIFETLKSYYKDNHQPIFDYLTLYDTVSKDYTPLLLASNRGALETIYTLLDFAEETFGHDKNLFFRFLTQATSNNEDNPLILLAWDNASHGLQYLLQKAAKVLGKKSQLFHDFINWKDNDGATAIVYAENPSDAALIKSFGGVSSYRLSPLKEQAKILNKKLMKAIEEGNFEKLQKIVFFGMKQFKGNDDALAVFFNNHDKDGWDALTHAISGGNKQLVSYLVEMYKHAFTDGYYRYNALNNVDKDGRTLLMLALERKEFEIAKILIQEMKALIDDPTVKDVNDFTFHMFMTFGDEFRGASPLGVLARRSGSDKKTEEMMVYMLEIMEDIYGRNSRAFDNFINQKDFNGRTPLDYVDNKEIKEILTDYGGRITGIERHLDFKEEPEPLSAKKIEILKTESVGPIHLTSPQTAAHQLFKAFELQDITLFKTILEQAAQKFSKKEFFEFINSRNENKLTPLLIATWLSDGEQLNLILDTIKKVYGNDTNALFAIVTNPGKEGATPLTVAGNRGARIISNRLVDFGVENFGHDKELFFKFINQPDKTNELNPIIALASNNNSHGLKYLVNRAARVLGKHSSLFFQFLNWVDNDQATAIDWLNDAGTIIHLKNVYGAQSGPENLKPADKKEAQAINKKLIKDMQIGNKKRFKKTLMAAIKKFAPNEDLLFEVIGEKGEYGWSPLAYAVVDGDKKMVEYIFDIIRTNFKNPAFRYLLLANIDRTGRSLLHLALERRNFTIAKIILNEMKELLEEKAIDKYALHNALTFLDENRGLSPLMTAVANSAGDPEDLEMINYLLNFAAKIYGTDSRAFERLLNEKDFAGYHALDYAETDDIKNLLTSYGAVLSPPGSASAPEELEDVEDEVEEVQSRSKARRSPARTKLEKIARTLLDAQKENNLPHFRKLLQEIAQNTSKKDFITILNTPDEIGLPLLLNAIGLSDEEQLKIILDTLKTAFKNDPQSIHNVLDQSSKEFGYPPLLTAASRGMPEIINLLLDFAQEVFANDKELFLEFISKPDKKDEDSPLTSMAWNNVSKGMHILVRKAAEFLGKNSPLFLRFINWIDDDGSTALQYTSNPGDKAFLRSFGAKPAPAQAASKIKEEAHALNKKLLKALYSGKLGEPKKVIEVALSKFGDNEDIMLEFIDHKDQDSWPPLTHAVGQGDTALVEYLLKVIKQVFKNPLFEYFALFNVDREGRTLLHIGFERRNFDLVKRIINAAKTLYNEGRIDRMLFHMFMTFRDEKRGLSPLMSAVINASDDPQELAAIEYLLKTMANIYGRDSRAFQTFINTKDFSGHTALDTANSEPMKKLLKYYGAVGT